MSDSEALAFIVELEDALTDMVAQHCLVSPSQHQSNGLRYHHNFISANEHAFSILEKYGCMEKDGKVWKIIQTPTIKET